MQITIVCVDRVYLWKIKNKSRHKAFYKINGQMYKVYTSELKRLRRKKYGEDAGTDDVIMYAENCRIPYESNNTTIYDQDAILEEIDAIKFAYRGKPKFGLWGRVSGNFDKWWPVLVLAIAGILIAAAFLG